jgi:soluble lytic murein transglycosylase-like protein
MNRLWLILLLWPASSKAQTQTQTLLEREIEWARYYARQYGVPAELVAAVIDVESAWRPDVVSKKGAAGLMQLMPATAHRFGVNNRFQIQENIRGGVAYLAHLMRQFGGDFRLATAAYYAGEQPIRKLGLACADADIYRYVAAVWRAYRLRQMAMLTSAASPNEGVPNP